MSGILGTRIITSAAASVLLVACSLLNRDGPNSTCADLQNGAENACSNGIIATCANGAVTYRVCDDESACSASWQTAGQFRCGQTDPQPVVSTTAPNPAGSGDTDDAGANGGDAAPSGAGTDSGVQAIAVCGSCPPGYDDVGNACNNACETCGCSQHMCVYPYATPVTRSDSSPGTPGQCPSGLHAVLTVQDCSGAGCATCKALSQCVSD